MGHLGLDTIWKKNKQVRKNSNNGRNTIYLGWKYAVRLQAGLRPDTARLRGLFVKQQHILKFGTSFCLIILIVNPVQRKVRPDLFQ